MAETGILPHEREGLIGLLDVLKTEQAGVADLRAEAMIQSSETWHDNAPADAANLEAVRISSEGKSLTQLLAREVKDYPDPESREVALGSCAILAIWGTEVGAVLVGIPQLYKEDEIKTNAEVEEVVIVSPESPLGVALVGLKEGDASEFAADGTRKFEFRVLGIEQNVLRDMYANLQNTPRDS